MQVGIILHFIHVAGTRIIVQGMDGLYRGILMEGFMAGGCMLYHVPLNKLSVQRSPGLEPWLHSCWGRVLSRVLHLEYWVFKGHSLQTVHKNRDGIWILQTCEGGYYVLFPPPAAASVAIEELTKALHKRPGAGHICFPHLMTYAWRKRVLKFASSVVMVLTSTRY